MDNVESNKLNLKKQRLTPSGCKEIGINKSLWQKLKSCMGNTTHKI